ncbi:hypothetical protein [Pseudarthrobacter oxydans]|uniref:hypothetical protein n=1 Tax=Pseudarthrobacter oxydans TaxID=1671 RepID=UPI003813DB04
MLPPVYTAIDGMFVRTNFTDLFAKLCLFLAVNILVAQIAKPLKATRALQLTAAIPGRLILVLVYGLEMILFALTTTDIPSPGLGAYMGDPVVFAYNAVTVLYVAFLCSLVIGPLFQQVRKAGHPFQRWSSSLVLAGFSLAILRAMVFLVGWVAPGLYEVGQSISAISALFVVSGLACAWLGLRKYSAPAIRQSHLRGESA